MSQGPEASFKNAINKLLPTSIYKEGMANPYRGGTPDMYYEGFKRSLWAEYKYLKNWPRVELDLTKKHLSSLQIKWLKRAYNNHQSVAVILGLPDKSGIIFTGLAWMYPITKQELKNSGGSRKEVAANVTEYLTSGY